MKLSAILFVASASAQYDSNYDNNYNDSNYAPAQEYDPYASEYAPYEAPAAEDERRGVQEPPSGARPGQQKSKLTTLGARVPIWGLFTYFRFFLKLRTPTQKT